MRNSVFQIRRPTNGAVRVSRKFLVFVLVALLVSWPLQDRVQATAGDLDPTYRPLSADETQVIFNTGNAGKGETDACCPSGSLNCAVTVPGTSNPWLSGMPNGTDAGDGDTAPNQSATEVNCLTVFPGDRLTFTPNGMVSNGPFSCCPVSGAEGDCFILSHSRGAQFGISNITAPLNSLVGVFLGPEPPDMSAPPSPLNFSASSERNYENISPLLKQVFFIGDGRRFTTAGLLCQSVIVPSGATRLFLGTMDGFGWINNVGAFGVAVCNSTISIFDICLQDDSNGNLLQFNSTTSDYQFTRCRSGLTLGGTGTLTRKGNLITLQHTTADRRVSAQIDTSTKKATASVQVFSQGTTFTITDRNMTNNTCSCP